MNAFTFNTTPRPVSAPRAARNLGALLKGLMGPNVFFVADPRKRRMRLEREAIASLEMQGFGVVASGGGSSTDFAKLVALLTGSGEVIDDAGRVENAQRPRLPFALIPTTAGTGSDVTPVSIMTESGAETRRVTSPILLPHIAPLAREAMKQARHLVNTPRTVTKEDALAIYRAAW